MGEVFPWTVFWRQSGPHLWYVKFLLKAVTRWQTWVLLRPMANGPLGSIIHSLVSDLPQTKPHSQEVLGPFFPGWA